MNNILLMSLNFVCIAVIYYDKKNFRKMHILLKSVIHIMDFIRKTSTPFIELYSYERVKCSR